MGKSIFHESARRERNSEHKVCEIYVNGATVCILCD